MKLSSYIDAAAAGWTIGLLIQTLFRGVPAPRPVVFVVAGGTAADADAPAGEGAEQ